jgi:hypothetical protein
MPRPLPPATAEQVVSSVEAVFVSRSISVDAAFVAGFADIPDAQAASALLLASEIGLVTDTGNGYKPSSPLCRLVVASDDVHRAAALRVVLESFEPFTVFRQRLEVTGSVHEAARQTKVLLDLDGHRDSIKDTLVSLGTYSAALTATGGGRYATTENIAGNPLQKLAEACSSLVEAESRVRGQIGEYPDARLSRTEVVSLLADALICAKDNNPRGAVVRAGNAVESHLSSLGSRIGTNLQQAHGINAKLERFRQVNALPTKIVNVGKYLGHLRNAADHGVDQEVNASWTISTSTGFEYVFVACSFIASSLIHEDGGPPTL